MSNTEFFADLDRLAALARAIKDMQAIPAIHQMPGNVGQEAVNFIREAYAAECANFLGDYRRVAPRTGVGASAPTTPGGYAMPNMGHPNPGVALPVAPAYAGQQITDTLHQPTTVIDGELVPVAKVTAGW